MSVEYIALPLETHQASTLIVAFQKTYCTITNSNLQGENKNVFRKVAAQIKANLVSIPLSSKDPQSHFKAISNKVLACWIYTAEIFLIQRKILYINPPFRW